MNVNIIFSFVGGQRFHRVLALLAALAVGLATARAARAEDGDPPEVEAQRLAHLLAYVAADYGDAVGDGGEIKVQAEYTEQIALLREARTTAKRLDQTATQPSAEKLEPLVETVQQLVDAKAPATDVAKEALKGR